MAGKLGNKNAEKWTREESQKFINSIYNYVEEDIRCTSLEKACCELGQYESLLWYLEKKYPEMDLEPIKKALALIKERLIDNGLTNKYNPTMCIFVLKNNHGMKDKNELDIGQITINWHEEKSY